MNVHSWPRLLAVLFAFALVPGLRAQTCTITSPTSGQILQSPQPFQLKAKVSSAPSAYKLIWTIDYQRWAAGYYADQHPTFNDYRDAWQGPFTVTWYTGLNGDGPHTVSGIIYDIVGNQLAACPTINFTVRIEGMNNQSISPAMPISGADGSFGMLTFDGNSRALAAIDGVLLDSFHDGAFQSYPAWTSQPGGWIINNFRTTQWPNGKHLIVAAYKIGDIADPYLLNKTFTNSGVSGNNIIIKSHFSYQGSIITFSNSGGALPSPLVAGFQWYWKTSATNPSNTITLSIAGGVMTFNCSSACGALPGTPVFIRNIQSTNQNTGFPNCDGYYFAATGSGSSFTVTAPPGCPDGAIATRALEVDVNPYFVNYVDANTISVSATPGGATVTLTSAGTGSQTVTQRIRSPYWTSSGSNGAPDPGPDYAQYGGVANVYQMATFSNGDAPMEIEVPYWELHLIAGGSAVSVCPKVKNTDLSLSSLPCTAFTYTLVPDGGFTGVASVSSGGSVSGLMAGWAQVQVSCFSCAAGGISLPAVTVYVQVHSGSITFPHFTHSGTVANAFSPGNSFFPLSAWQLNIVGATSYQTVPTARPLWYGPMMQEANLNSSIISADPSGTAFGDPASISCSSPSWPSAYHSYESAFAAEYGTYFELDTESTHWGSGGPGFLAALLNNTGYNRQACFTGFLSNLVSEGRTWRTVGYDELNQYMAGNYPFRNPNLGSTDFPSIVVSGCPGSCVATYNVGEAMSGVWNQSTGAGSWIKMAGAVTHTCLNGWFPVTAYNNSGNFVKSFSTPSTCANGTYTESTAQLYHYWNGAGLTENQTTLPRKYGAGGDPNVTTQGWDSNYFTQIVVSGGVAEFDMPGNGIANGQAIRIHGSVHNLNTVKPVTVIDANHFRITYNSLLETVPSNGTYTSSNDANIYVTVDGNFPPTPFLSLRKIFTGIPGHPATTWGAIGFTYGVSSPGVSINPGVRNWAGNPVGEDAVFAYSAPFPPLPIFGPDASVWEWVHYTFPFSGLATRGYQLQPRAMLFGAGPDGRWYCRSYTFNPGCDRPSQLDWRPETLVTQMVAMIMLNVSALRLYNFTGNMGDAYTGSCCGWGAPGTGTGSGINPATSPRQWAAMAYTDALIKLREDTELQPSANKPYLGPMFMTDAHTSSTYGNELKILCGSEMPYGSFTVNLPTISGGTVLKYVLTGYSLMVTQLPGSPSTDTDEFCGQVRYPSIPAPGRTTIYVAQPPGVNVLDYITFSPPSPLPFGASKFLIQVGYYPRAMQDDPITDCSLVCTIMIDHHNSAAWYRVIYADTNNLPRSIGNPVRIPSQGLY
jgi:hypothetical protein